MALERLKLFGPHFALSWAVTVGDVVHLAGMTGMEVDFTAAAFPGFTYPSGHEAQMRQCYRNIAWILEQVGSTLGDIADQTIFFVGDPAAVVAANRKVRTEVFGSDAPASSLVGRGGTPSPGVPPGDQGVGLSERPPMTLRCGGHGAQSMSIVIRLERSTSGVRVRQLEDEGERP